MQKFQLRDMERSTLEYLQSSTREMAQMAQAGRFPVVAYFLEMAHLEISDIIRGTVYPRPTNNEAILARRAG
jgi:hypothetical protein